MLKSLKLRVSNWLLKHLFNAVTEDSFLQVKFLDKEKKTGTIFVGTEQLKPEQIRNLAVEARTIKQLDAYRRVVDSMQWTANEMIFNKSQTIDDVVFGKAMLYALHVLDKKLENIGRL